MSDHNELIKTIKTLQSNAHQMTAYLPPEAGYGFKTCMDDIAKAIQNLDERLEKLEQGK